MMRPRNKIKFHCGMKCFNFHNELKTLNIKLLITEFLDDDNDEEEEEERESVCDREAERERERERERR
jgi:hypothetical protein